MARSQRTLRKYSSIFVTGIDTDAGKSYATAWLAMQYLQEGKKVVTQKFIQTGNDGYSEDIDLHRRLMQQPHNEADYQGLTAPLIFNYPASAQLAAQLDGREIDFSIIDSARTQLERLYDIVLVEGAGGLMVPIDDSTFTIDYIASRKLPVVLVTNSRLGSINHTVLSLEAIRRRRLKLLAVIYNHHFDTSPEIAADTRRFIGQYIERNFPRTSIMDMPSMELPAPVAEPPRMPRLSISKEAMADMPNVVFGGKIDIIDTPQLAERALDILEAFSVIGFDTETKPSFRKGDVHKVALVQLSTASHSFLFRVNRIGIPPRLKNLLENPDITKVGLSIKDDYNALRRIEPIEPKGFVELQKFVTDYGIVDGSLQKIYAIMFGERISKGQRLSNWEADTLSEPQKQYASIDAWACLRIFSSLLSGEFDPSANPYNVNN